MLSKLKDRTLVIIAIILGMVIFALFYVKSVTADELPDISESVNHQEAFVEKDLNHIVLKGIEAPNKIFKGWTDDNEGNGRIYKAGDKLDISQGIIIYPLWENIILKTGIGSLKELESGKDLVLDTLNTRVGTGGLDISPSVIGLKAEAKNEGCAVNIFIDDIKVDRDMQADGYVLYPDFEDEDSEVGINIIYKLQVIHDGKIVGSSLVTLPVRCTPEDGLFEEYKEESTPTPVIMDEAGNSFVVE